MDTKTNKSKKVKRLPPGTPNPVDVHVGARVRLRRTLLGKSQEEVGNALGLTFQQQQKYERGANRIGASRIWQLSIILDVPVSFFFDDMPDGIKSHSGQLAIGPTQEHEADPMARRENLELLRSYMSIDDPALKKAIYAMVKAAGKHVQDQE